MFILYYCNINNFKEQHDAKIAHLSPFCIIVITNLKDLITIEFEITMQYPWYLYCTVTQNMLRTHELN